MQIQMMQTNYEKQIRQMESMFANINVQNQNIRDNNPQISQNNRSNRSNQNPIRQNIPINPNRNREFRNDNRLSQLNNDGDSTDSIESSNFNNNNDRNNSRYVRKTNYARLWKLQYSGNNSPSLDQFLALVDAHRKADGLSKEMVFKSAIHLLKDSALDIYLSKMDRIRDWDSLVSVLRSAFDGGNSQHNLRIRIDQTMQGPKESFASFLARISNLIKCTNPLMPEYEQIYLIKRNMSDEISSRLALYEIDSVELLETLAMRVERNLSEISMRYKNSKHLNYDKPNQICETQFDKVDKIPNISEDIPEDISIEAIDNPKYQNFNKNQNQNRNFQNNNFRSQNQVQSNNSNKNFQNNRNNLPINNNTNRNNLNSNPSQTNNNNNVRQNNQPSTNTNANNNPNNRYRPYYQICSTNEHGIKQCKFNLLALAQNVKLNPNTNANPLVNKPNPPVNQNNVNIIDDSPLENLIDPIDESNFQLEDLDPMIR